MRVVHAIRPRVNTIFIRVLNFWFFWFLLKYGSLLFRIILDAVTDERVAPSRKKFMEADEDGYMLPVFITGPHSL